MAFNRSAYPAFRAFMMAALMLALVLSSSYAHEGRDQPRREDEVLDAARAIMKAAKYCFLITLDKSGQPQARVMGSLDLELDMDVWMATNPKTRKVQEIRGDSRATLAYYDPKGDGYVTLVGRAHMVDDLREKRLHWREELRPFFPQGPEGGDYILIKFVSARVEVMSFSLGIATRPFTFRPQSSIEKTPGGFLRSDRGNGSSCSLRSIGVSHDLLSSRTGFTLLFSPN